MYKSEKGILFERNFGETLGPVISQGTVYCVIYKGLQDKTHF